MNREELAWAAGLFEGEGCFSFNKKHSRGFRAINATIVMTDLDVLEQFKSVIGFGNILPVTTKGNRKPQWAWRIGSFEETQALIAMLWPWLKSRRRTKIVEGLRSYHEKKPVSLTTRLTRTSEILADLSDGKLSQTAIGKKHGICHQAVSKIKHKHAVPMNTGAKN